MSTVVSVVAAFQRVLSSLQKLNEGELEKLLDPTYDVEIKVVRRRSKEEAGNSSGLNMTAIVKQLTESTSRDMALNYLASTIETKKTLEEIARHLDIPIIKSDKVEVLRDRIIEATVGARLRSEAIKGIG